MRVGRNLRALKFAISIFDIFFFLTIVRLIKVMYNFFYHSSEKKSVLVLSPLIFHCPFKMQVCPCSRVYFFTLTCLLRDSNVLHFCIINELQG